MIDNWKSIRKAILDMDDYVCRICFKDTSIAQLHVHHMDYNRDNNTAGNLVTLCRTCHANIHQHDYKPFDHIDWPVPWKICRPEEEEFQSLIKAIKRTSTSSRKRAKKADVVKDFPSLNLPSWGFSLSNGGFVVSLHKP